MIVMDNLSVLYQVQPISVGQWDCEGLVSYLCRLANAHSVAVDDLVNRCLSPCSGYDFRTWRHFSWWNRSAAVSLFAPGRTERLETALAIATGLSAVRHLSLAALLPALDLAGMAADGARHCPECLRERPYPAAFRPILWDVNVVTVCPRHAIRLAPSRCGSPPAHYLGLWCRRQVPGVCARCGSLGLSCGGIPVERAAGVEMWVATQTGEMIAAVSGGEQFSPERVQQGVLAMATRIGEGRPYRAAAICGFSKARLFDWINGNRRIKFAPLLALCAAAGSDIVSALRGQPNYTVTGAFRYVCHRRPSERPSTVERRRAVLAALEAPACPSVAIVARQLGIHRTTLERTCPNEVHLLVERLRTLRRSEAIQRRVEATARLETAISHLRGAGKPVTVRNLYFESGILILKGSRFEPILLALCSYGPKFVKEDSREIKHSRANDV